MLNSYTDVLALFEHPLNDYKGYTDSRVLHDFYELDPQKTGFYGGGGLDARFDFTPITFAMGGYPVSGSPSGLPPDTPRWGRGFKNALSHNFTRTMKIVAQGILKAPAPARRIRRKSAGRPAHWVSTHRKSDGREIETGVEPAASIESGLLRVKFVKVVEDAAIGIPLVIVQRMFKQRQHVSVTIEHQVFADQTA